MKQLALLIVGILAAPTLLGQSVTSDPQKTVEYFHTQLIASTGKSDYQARYEYLEPVINRTFSAETIARIALGRNWRTLDDEQKARLTALMKELIISSYAGRFIKKGPRFNIESTREIGPRRTMVRSTLVTPEGEAVDLDYQLVNEDGEWRIFDVIANGVSDLSLKRSVYATEFTRDGFDGVIASIRSNIEGNEP